MKSQSLTKKSRLTSVGCFFLIFLYSVATANPSVVSLPSQWSTLEPIIIARLNQKKPKMKLNEKQVNTLVIFLQTTKVPTPHLLKLQTVLPKTTIELLRATQERGLAIDKAEKMANYLHEITDQFGFQNVAAFDENTSHIIGRQWHEIDYSGENMTWQGQKKKYQQYGIDDFKSLDSLMKFFPVESKLPYFRKIYRPQNVNGATVKK